MSRNRSGSDGEPAVRWTSQKRHGEEEGGWGSSVPGELLASPAAPWVPVRCVQQPGPPAVLSQPGASAGFPHPSARPASFSKFPKAATF